MNVVLWVVTGLLAAAVLAAGVLKVVRPRERLQSAGMTWVEDFSDGMVKLVGVLEVLAAIGLVLPALLHIAPVFVPLAALGLVLVMIGAVVVHLRRSEASTMAPAVVLLVMAAFVMWGRFGPYSFTS
ncbi:DoxX family protein [Actinophytocola sp.]|uniref:DoxX family protein n=1 Tax=Actinophytocola sp. TaxID=1872138 RepID=UPI00389AC85A